MKEVAKTKRALLKALVFLVPAVVGAQSFVRPQEPQGLYWLEGDTLVVARKTVQAQGRIAIVREGNILRSVGFLSNYDVATNKEDGLEIIDSPMTLLSSGAVAMNLGIGASGGFLAEGKAYVLRSTDSPPLSLSRPAWKLLRLNKSETSPTALAEHPEGIYDLTGYAGRNEVSGILAIVWTGLQAEADGSDYIILRLQTTSETDSGLRLAATLRGFARRDGKMSIDTATVGTKKIDGFGQCIAGVCNITISVDDMAAPVSIAGQKYIRAIRLNGAVR